MQPVLRLLVGALGLGGIGIGLRFWFAPAELGARLGVAPLDALGEATIRADMAGFFAGAGAFALAAAIRNHARLLTAPLVLVAIALSGRVITAATAGFTPEMGPPMAIEAVLLAVFAAGRRFLKAP